MRYELRFLNGYWTIFDAFNYRPVELYGLKIDADAAVIEWNDDFKKNNKARQQ